MTREVSPKLAILLLALGVALVIVSAQPTQVAAATGVSNPQGSYWPNGYNSPYYCSNYYWWNYWSYPYYCNYYFYYPYYYGYPYYYSSYYFPASYTLTVSTNPSNLGTVTGGGTYTQGSSASFSVTQSTVQVSSSMRYVFSHWAGDYSGVGLSGAVTVNGAMTVTAVYQLQYYLSVSVQPQSAPIPQGEGWYNAGDTVILQNSGQTIGGTDGSRLVFQGWSVDSQSPQTGSSLNIAMNASHNVTALYGHQFYLNVQSDQGVTYGSGWYDAGSTAQIYVSTPISTSYGISIVFNGWQGDIQSGSQATTVVMDGPKNVIATWRTDSTVLYLTIGAIIVAAVLIVAGVIVFVARGRSSTQAPPSQAPPAQPQTPRNNVQQTEPVSAQRSEHHRRKTTTEKATTEKTTESVPSENPTSEDTQSTQSGA